ncbi:DUF2268 domain-containing putative Zn-dependent protease [Sutcliffiella halmapala]|uniref:DUF2268 domain-containing putative Zn-dependent protease n=1 Tax=Sutcliffiella halmapala TaxID=79882 RepID=UPI000995291A|nr:DUF2268 domain-containing putative Zn-dependent protease [Sutcliffiella halmapala]
MQLKGFIFFFIIILALTGCSKGESVGSESIEDGLSVTFENPDNEQKFEIIHAYQLFNPFYEESKNIPKDEHLDLYKSSIIDPVYDKCFKDGEYEFLAESILNEEPKNRIAIQDVIKKINFTSTNDAIKDALIKSSNLLPSEKETTVCVFPTNDNSTLMFTAGSGKIIVLYNRNYSSDIIKAGIAHEYHHSVWTEKHHTNDSFTVLDNLVFEGKAVMFEKTVFPSINITQIDETFRPDQWAKIEGDLSNTDDTRALLILRGSKEGFPKQYGYSEGYKMVQAYLDVNPDATVEEWTGKSADEIFEEGNYQANYQ